MSAAFSAAAEAGYIAATRLLGALIAIKASADPASPLALAAMNEASNAAGVLANRMSDLTAHIAEAHRRPEPFPELVNLSAITPLGRDPEGAA